MKNIFYLFILTSSMTLTSCSSLINKYHRQFDRMANKKAAVKRAKPGTLEHFKNRKFRNRYSTRNRKSLSPSTRRRYTAQARQRTQAKNLFDNGNDGSLWSDIGQENFLFAKNNKKRLGDVVIINVLEKLKKEITIKLQQAYPKIVRKKKKSKAAAKKPAEEAAAQQTGKKAASRKAIYDRIPSFVIEEVNNDNIIVRGKREIFFRNKKRFVEVEALIDQKDILDDDRINSSDILEKTVTVVR